MPGADSKDTKHSPVIELNLFARASKKSYLFHSNVLPAYEDVARHFMSFLSGHDLSVLARVSKTGIGAIGRHAFKDSTEKSLIVYIETGSSLKRYESQFPDEKTIKGILSSDKITECLNQLVALLETPLEYYLRHVLSSDISFSRDIHRPREFVFSNLPSEAIAGILKSQVLALRFNATILNLTNKIREKLHGLFSSFIHFMYSPYWPTEVAIVDGLKRFINRGVDVNIDSERNGWRSMASPLSHLLNFPEAVTTLLQAGADPNKKNTEGNTILSSSIFSLGRITTSVMMALIHAGFNVNATDATDVTPLMLVAANPDKMLAVMPLLLEAKADVNTTNHKGLTALMVAASRVGGSILSDEELNVKVINTLLDAKADVNKVNWNGNTALMEAAECGFSKIVERLIQAGADVHVQNSTGNNALSLSITKFKEKQRRPFPVHFIEDFGYRETMDLLIKHGAKPPLKSAEQTQPAGPSFCMVM